MICTECTKNAELGEYVCSDECHAKFIIRWEGTFEK